MVISHNLLAMNANRQFNITNKSIAKSTEKLSSGYRINRAADDAAGLAISEKMRRQIRGLSQGIRNTEEGVSLCQVADGALGEVSEMLHRITELSVQSANATYTDEDREAIQQEISQILQEIDRIGESTEFNTKKIFAGSEGSTGVSGIGGKPSTTKNSVVQLSVTGTPDDKTPTKYTINADNSGISIGADSFSWNDFKSANGKALDNNAPKGSVYSIKYKGMNISLTIKDDNKSLDDIAKNINQSKLETYVASSTSKQAISSVYATGTMNNIASDFTKSQRYLKVDTTNNRVDVKSDYVDTNGIPIEAYTFYNDEIIKAGTQRVNLKEFSGSSNTMILFVETAVDMTADEFYSMLDGAIVQDYFSDKTLILDCPDTSQSLIKNTNPKSSNIFMEFKQFDKIKPFEKDVSLKFDFIDDGGTVALMREDGVKFSLDGEYDMVPDGHYYSFEAKEAAEGSINIFGQLDSDWKDKLANGSYSLEFTAHDTSWSNTPVNTRYVKGLTLKNNGILTVNTMGVKFQQVKAPNNTNPPSSSVDNDDKLKLWIQSGSEAGHGMYLEIDPMNTSILGISDLDVSTVEGANYALDAVKGALEKVSYNRSKIGAQQNRLEHTIANEQNIVENTTAAESRIRDTDMAKEMVAFSLATILGNAGQAMISQANKSNQEVLSLLQ